MLEPLRRAIGLALARWHFRRRTEEPISFTRAITEARHALVVLPLGTLELPPLVPVLEVLREKFQDKHITVVTVMHSVELMRTLPQGRFVRLDPTELSPFFLPRASMLQRMPRPAYDLAIDLNLDFKLPSGYICRESNARVRVGFAGEQSDLFYNFQFQTTAVPGKQRYQQLAAYLEMF